ncbi:hypothetical protein FB451DRAFT_159485 [Mycena latifolia]|nr:hypothetical protein FB451DRAFT_159485 [Mycena latifolia]
MCTMITATFIMIITNVGSTRVGWLLDALFRIPPKKKSTGLSLLTPTLHIFGLAEFFPYAAESSVEPIARNIARARGGTTLELALERANIVMPVYNQTDEDSTYIWNYASRQFALRAFGNVVVVRGQTRENNIWDTEEFPALTKGENSNVRCILQMNEDDSFVDPVLIWPEPGSAGYDYCLEQRTAAWRAQATHL